MIAFASSRFSWDTLSQEENEMADINVNDAQWKSLSQEDKDRVTRILTSSGLLKRGDGIKGVSTVAAPAIMGNIFCTIACDAAQAAATAACAALSGPLAAACIAAAQAGGDYCRSQC